MVLWGWGQRVNGGHSRFPDKDKGMRLGVLDLRSSMKDVGLSSAYLLPWEELPLGKYGVSAGVQVWDNSTTWGMKIRTGWFVRSTGSVDRVRESCSWHSVAVLGTRPCALGNREGRGRSSGSLVGFLAGVACSLIGGPLLISLNKCILLSMIQGMNSHRR